MARRVISIIFVALLALMFSHVSFAKGEGLTQTNPSQEVKVGIYLIRAGSLDTSTGAIDVDFYIEFTCPSECEKGMTDFEVVNGVTKSKALVEDEESAYKPTYRVAATVFQEVSLKKYPFDSHEIKIIIEGNRDKSELTYVVNPQTTSIAPDVFILGWEMNHTPTAQIVDQYYEAWDLHYDRYEFLTTLTKPPLAGWMKGLLPAIFIAMGCLLGLFITTKNITNRVSIVTSALIASVLYHINFTSRVPPIGYLTFGDIFMIINYIVILTVLTITIWMIRVDDEKRIAKVNKIEIAIIPLLWLALHFLNAILIL